MMFQPHLTEMRFQHYKISKARGWCISNRYLYTVSAISRAKPVGDNGVSTLPKQGGYLLQ